MTRLELTEYALARLVWTFIMVLVSLHASLDRLESLDRVSVLKVKRP
jgi:hypothetical protein